MDSGVQKSDILGTIEFKTKAAARKEPDMQLAKIKERIAGIIVSGLWIVSNSSGKRAPRYALSP